MDNATRVTGSCLCGAVRLQATLTSRKVDACHCSMCRKWSGGPLLCVSAAPGAALEGTEHITDYASSDWAERGFCSRCGTHLYYRLRQTGEYMIPVGLLDDPGGLRFEEQIFIDEKPGYYEFANKTHNLTGAEVFAKFAAGNGD